MISTGYKTSDHLFFTISGQSDAVGTNTGTQYSPHLIKAMIRVFIWTGIKYENLEYLVNNQGNTHAAELNLGYIASHLTSGNVYIMKKGQGGTSLAVDWADGSALWNDFVSDQNDAYNWLIADSKKVRYIGNWWNQGQNDANDLGFSNDYRDNLTGLVNRFKRDCVGIAEGWQFVTVRLSSKLQYPYLATVREAQEEWKYVNVDDLDISSDGVHFISDAQNVMGERFLAKCINSI